jgi:hypothetical protein
MVLKRENIYFIYFIYHAFSVLMTDEKNEHKYLDIETELISSLFLIKFPESNDRHFRCI